MEALLDSIRIAVSDGASDDERRRGLAACRAVADALESGVVIDASTPPLVTSAEPAADEAVPRAGLATVTPTVNPLASNPFAGMNADDILELAIAKLRGAIGDEPAPSPAAPGFRITLVPLPRVR